MNDKLQSFITSLGAMCEIWTLTYKSFITQGMDKKEALTHTQSFMTSFMNTIVNCSNDGGKK